MFHRESLRIVLKTIVGISLILLALSLCESAEAAKINCNKHPIYCQIKKNRPKIDKKFAMKLSNIIYKNTKKYHIPPRIFTAILAQESGYKLSAKGCHRGLVRKETKAESNFATMETVVEYEEVRICADFGIGQIYFKTARGFKFDIERLTTDLEYSVEAAAKVLADFQKRYSAKEVNWWTRYNARSKIKRRIYKELVKRYF